MMGKRTPQDKLFAADHVYLDFVGRDGVAEESGDRAKLAAVRTASSRFNRHDMKCSPVFPEILEQGVQQFGNEIELVEIKLVPWNRGIWIQGRLALLARSIKTGKAPNSGDAIS